MELSQDAQRFESLVANIINDDYQRRVATPSNEDGVAPDMLVSEQTNAVVIALLKRQYISLMSSIEDKEQGFKALREYNKYIVSMVENYAEQLLAMLEKQNSKEQ